MTTERLRTAQLIVTLIIASQGIFYLLAAAEAFRNISVHSFAEQRKAVDAIIGGRIKVLYYSCLLLGVIIAVSLRSQPASMGFICTLISTLLILADIIIAIKVNVPINKQFAAYPAGSMNWELLRTKWLNYISIRGILSVLALLSLLISWRR